jgi:hypothetical protein
MALQLTRFGFRTIRLVPQAVSVPSPDMFPLRLGVLTCYILPDVSEREPYGSLPNISEGSQASLHDIREFVRLDFKFYIFLHGWIVAGRRRGLSKQGVLKLRESWSTRLAQAGLRKNV